MGTGQLELSTIFFLQDNCVSVGITSLTLTAILKDSNNHPISGLSGNTTIPFRSCWANYTDLTLLRTGEYTVLDPHIYTDKQGQLQLNEAFCNTLVNKLQKSDSYEYTIPYFRKHAVQLTKIYLTCKTKQKLK